MQKRGSNQEAAKILQNTLVPSEVHAEYIGFHDHVVQNKYSREQVIEKSKELLRKRTPLEEKKEILFCLAHTPVLRAHYAIQKYLKNPDRELVTWAVVAWHESHTGVLNEGMRTLFGGNTAEEVVVMGGLGGDGKRLRYCFVVSSLKGHPFSIDQEETIRAALKEDSDHVKTEKIEFGENYAVVTPLVLIEGAVGEFIESLINYCNKPVPFLRFHYFVVNTHLLSKEEINEYLQKFEARGF
ncbi:MAG: hypothetical protein A3A44_03250 [Candidatus Sungbacteria bacterium RIFCSPLOWO2_01_FULL_60_25]|uniref:Uncharacterized protein n=2 Tax=Candidatus Sungiibacteriota TaxID=1817917 RepID=A0A1G2LFK5_9BACT|nr:MAG: hypothetical protein A3C16_02190 [Candidatus Sungbacteria bacterium RIFCSPHIGHO2_02_FULL_51_29]OHA09589.1 MAG: hypothetical protein A3A44_03250 [Candidatus Sungbacteria bacterium RIFCSPLOWO2_01_FULL_60_25]